MNLRKLISLKISQCKTVWKASEVTSLLSCHDTAMFGEDGASRLDISSDSAGMVQSFRLLPLLHGGNR